MAKVDLIKVTKIFQKKVVAVKDVTFTVEDNMVIDGTVAAVGSDFTDPDELGCNGTFPALVLKGGKME